MSNLISRQDAINAFDGAKVDGQYCTDYEIGYNDGIDFAISKLSVLPTADVIEVVRCKDCYHYPNPYADCPMIGWPRNEDDYCSYAERRTNR